MHSNLVELFRFTLWPLVAVVNVIDCIFSMKLRQAIYHVFVAATLVLLVACIPYLVFWLFGGIRSDMSTVTSRVFVLEVVIITYVPYVLSGRFYRIHLRESYRFDPFSLF